MAQPNKGPRRLVKMPPPPEYLTSGIDRYSLDRGLTGSEAIADLCATALELNLPSQTLPRPRTAQAAGQELIRLERAVPRPIRMTRIPLYVLDRVDGYAEQHDLCRAEAVADLCADALQLPLPSKSAHRQRGQAADQVALPINEEVMPLGKAS